ncbi:hypothetical protein OE88DRAFT_1005609 [Heliocybe sulcata]|uniref:Vacuolar import and degradation protein 21 n=1 Tax=Heliocybe sulcata TaxID=5364 RepID=A0A5C3NGJ4_9AGAM|nr:hypothetical protein OE88DRAFT_1005609 [Heliocybe sulcata]
MSTPPVDPQVEERVAQLEAVSQRRNELLREMYHLLHRRRNIGVMLPDPEEEEDGSDLETFLDRFDLRKHPDTGNIENLAELDLCLSPLPSSDNELATEELPSEHSGSPAKNTLGARSDSPMSEPPASPESVPEGGPDSPEIEEDLQYPDVSGAPVQVDRSRSEDSAVSPAAEHGGDELDASEREVSLAPALSEEDDNGEEDRDELDLISNRSSASYQGGTVSQSRRSPPAFPEEEEEEEEEEEKDIARDVSEAAQSTTEVEQAAEIEEDVEPEEDPLHEISVKADGSDQEDDTMNYDMASEGPEEPGVSEGRTYSEQDERSSDGVNEQSLTAVQAPTSEEDVAMTELVEGSISVPEDQSNEGNAAIEPRSSPESSQAGAIALQSFQSDEVQLHVGMSSQDSSQDTLRTDPVTEEGAVVQRPIRRPVEVHHGAEESEFSPLSSGVSTPLAGDTQIQPVQYVIPVPSSPIHDYPSYDFSPLAQLQDASVRHPAAPSGRAVPPVKQSYTLPPLKVLPPDFNRKGKPTKQRKRDKDRDKGDKALERLEGKDSAPLGVNRWGATLRANPVWKRVSRAQKCISTRDWNIAYTEMRFVRALDRIELLKDKGKWSFRQPKKQRTVGITMKTHWDYLLEEMKWMRVDFREERKFKLAIAFDLACAAVDWHAAGTTEERHKLGICVFWKCPRPSQEPAQSEEDIEAELEEEELEGAPSREDKNPMSMIDYPSSEASEAEDDQEQENGAQETDAIDALDAGTTFRDALNDLERNRDIESVEPKVEDIEEQYAVPADQNGAVDLGNATDNDNALEAAKTGKDGTSVVESAMKPGASDPILGPSSTHSRPITYLRLRDNVVYSDADTLFLDLDDFDIYKRPPSTTSDEDAFRAPHPPTDLSEIFPELRPLGLLEPPATAIAVIEGKKKGDKKEDPHRRVDETNLTKLTPVSQFMHVKPTLIGSVQPSKRWRHGKWCPSQEPVVLTDFDNISFRVQPDKLPQSGLFVGHTKANNEGPSREHYMAPPAPKDAKKRVTEYPWTANEDSLLKSLADKFPNNWQLVAECFNSSWIVHSPDKRMPWDCYERWCTKWGSGSTLRELSETSHRDMPPPPPPGQMTTRGIKRSASAMQSPTSPNPNIAALSGPLVLNTDNRKRRRHQLMSETMKKAAKRREAAQKSAVGQRKPAAVHDTHGQYNSLPKHTPLELSRKKAEKDAKQSEAMRRDQELVRQQHLQNQRHLQGIQGVPNLAQLQQAQMLQQQQNASRLPGTALPSSALPQIRSQVNISQQRLPNINAGQTARLPEQIQSNTVQASPPRTTATPTNPPNPTRPPSAQSHQNTMPAMQGVQQGAMPRPIPNIGHYYQLHGASMSPEQMQEALRLQNMQYATLHAHAYQVRAQHAQNAQAQPAAGQGAMPQTGQPAQYPQQ